MGRLGVLLFLYGVIAASVFWVGVGFMLWQAHTQHVQAALDLPRASSRAQLRQHLTHSRRAGR